MQGVDFNIFIDGKLHGNRREWPILPRIGDGLIVSDSSGKPRLTRVLDVIIGGCPSNECVADLHVSQVEIITSSVVEAASTS